MTLKIDVEMTVRASKSLIKNSVNLVENMIKISH